MRSDYFAIGLALVGLYFGLVIGTYRERRNWSKALNKRLQWIYDKRISQEDFQYVVSDLLYDVDGMGWRKRLLNADLIYLPRKWRRYTDERNTDP